MPCLDLWTVGLEQDLVVCFPFWDLFPFLDQLPKDNGGVIQGDTGAVIQEDTIQKSRLDCQLQRTTLDHGVVGLVGWKGP